MAALAQKSRGGAGRRYVVRIIAPTVAAVLIVAVIVAALMLLSARQADYLATHRQQKLVATVLAQSIARTAHDQESSTIWDDAVREVRKPVLDLDWIDANLGVWLYSYYNHDEVFLVDPNGRPIYGMRAGRRVPLITYDRDIRSMAMPLIEQLRRKLRHPSPGDVSTSVRSPGAIDLGVVASHPAIVSVKPILADTGKVEQDPGAAFLHISVRYIDGTFVHQLAEQYQLDRATFSRFAPAEQRKGVALTNTSGQRLGYLTWVPFRPGSLMMRRVAPLLVLALLVIITVVTVLLRHVRRSTLALEASEAQAQHLAFHDPLTGLPNRAMFEDRLAHELAGIRGPSQFVALLYLDLDGFKTVNDTLGHPAGDELVQEVGRRLAATVRSTDLVARIGGDEFAIVQCDIDTPAAAEILCMRIIEAIDVPFEIAGSQARVGISLGIAMGPSDAAERSELTRKADIALYESKAAGKGRYTFFAEGMDASIQRRRGIEDSLRTALERGNQLEVYYQPLYSGRTGAVTGAEALVRWHHPQYGMISPAMFIPIAEQVGLIEQLGEWVLEQACRAAVHWPIDTISVNVSAVQLRNSDFFDRVMAVLDASGLDPSRLELEITETSFIENAANCQPNLIALRQRGVKLALDDFGTGYSSFTHLQNFAVDRLKIDRSFVSAIGADEEGSPIIQAIVDLAKASGLKITAEGVETMKQSAFLSQVGCNSLQGFFLARPMPASAIDSIFGLPETASAFDPLNAEEASI
ncbi:putative bifunctional diguanylate cyclase/phosphodiesterase [Sphingomonas sp. PB4P5]|uniref:putative bifunctional diguanylate cyclase/phosphodiesterase n=1 Tax=Parasphingomonas puruogangriensis TaxID=3096155 RepID=UPI002FCBEB34